MSDFMIQRYVDTYNYCVGIWNEMYRITDSYNDLRNCCRETILIDGDIPFSDEFNDLNQKASDVYSDLDDLFNIMSWKIDS